MPGLEMIAASVVGVVVPYLVNGAEEFAKSAGKGAYETVKSLVGSIKQRFSRDKEASHVLEMAAEKPERYSGLLGDLLRETMEKDPEFVRTLEAAMKALGPTVNVIHRLGEAKDVTGAEVGTMKSGSLSVQQDIGKAERVIGAKIDNLG